MDLQKEMFEERQRQLKANNKRVEVYGRIHANGEKVFLHSHLGMAAALSYSMKHSRIFPDRFDDYIYGNLQQVEDGSYSVFKPTKEDNTWTIL